MKAPIQLIIFGLFVIHPYLATAQCDVEVSVPANIVICEPGNVDLEGVINGSESCLLWTSDQGFFEDQDQDISVFVDVETNFIFTAFGSTPGPNLIVNGDFESGDSGFTTDYYSGMAGCTPTNWGFLECEGAYDVISNPQDGHTNFDDCAPCEGGLQMVVNGAASFQQIWCQTVDVEINAKYLFSAQAQSVNPGSPALLQFSIDGNDIGNVLGLSSSTCSCESIEEYWVSDQTGSVEICVLNQNTAAGGNDFALDDIKFQPLCSDTAHVNIKVSDLMTDPQFPVELTCETTEVLLDVGASGSFTPLDYVWISPDGWNVDDVGDGEAYVYSPGEYSVVVTDEFGCSIETFFEVFEDIAPPTVDLFPPNPIIECEDPFVEVYNNDDDPNYIYEWELDGLNYGQLNFLQADAPGLYSVTVTDVTTGCTEIVEIYIDQDADAPEVTIDYTNEIGCGNPTSVLSFDSPDNITDFTWFDSNDQPLASTTVSEGGDYYVTVTSLNGCTGEAFTTIPEFDFDPQYSISDPGIINCTLTQTQLTVTTNNNYILTWSGPNNFMQNGSSITITEGGTYTLIISDGNCDFPVQVEVLEDTAIPPLDLSPIMDIDCGVPSVPISAIAADPANNYTWTLPNNTMQSGATINANMGGTYNLLVSSANGCTNDTTFIINQAGNLPVLQLIPDTVTCLTPMVNLDNAASGTFGSLQWTDQLGQVVSGNVNQQGWYYALADNGNGCSLVDSIFIVVDTLVQVPGFPSEILNCNNPSITLIDPFDQANGWQLPDGTMEFADSLLITEPGLYTFNFTETNGCPGSVPINIDSDFADPSLTDADIDTLDCISGISEVTLMTGPGIDSIIAFQNGVSTTFFGNNLTFTQGGEVNLTLVGNNGCTTVEIIDIPIDTLIPDVVLSIQNIDCNNLTGIVEIQNPESGVDYNWINSPTSDTSFESTDEGTFTVVATDIASGCSISQVFEITADTISPSLTFMVDSLNCSNPSTNIEVEADGTYTYEWSSPSGINSTEEDIFITEIGDYQVTAFADNGCTAEYTVEVPGDLSEPEYNLLPINAITCLETSTQINLDFNSPISGATADFDGQIFDFDSGILETELVGEFTITVYGENGCTSELITDIPTDTIAPISQVDFNNINCINTEGIASIVNPQTDVDYTWFEDGEIFSTQNSITVDEATTIGLLSVGLNGCSSDNEIQIEIDTVGPPIFAQASDINCINANAEVSVQDPIQGIEYEWTGINNFQSQELSFTTTEIGTYTLTAFDPLNGCSSITQVEVTELTDLPIAFDFLLLEPNCGESEFSISDFTIQGGTEPYQYNTGNGWENLDQENILLPGNQEITIMDANGCSLDTSFTLSIPESLEAEIEESILVNWGESTSPELILNKPLEDIESIMWSPSTGLSCDDCLSPTISILEDQTYTITVIDKDGCEDVVTLRIQVQKKIAVYLPNVFTPDGIDNRRFFPFGTAQHITNVSDFQIFDRWGNRVFLNQEFLPNEESEGWDGTFNNEQATEGVYAYLLTINYLDGTSEVLAGDVTLVR